MGVRFALEQKHTPTTQEEFILELEGKIAGRCYGQENGKD